jgi:hypothetical protein
LNRESFQKSIFNVAEYLTKHPLSDRGKKLLIHYFNQSDKSSSLLKALHAIERYYPGSMPSIEERSPVLIKLIDGMEEEAGLWDNE